MLQLRNCKAPIFGIRIMDPVAIGGRPWWLQPATAEPLSSKGWGSSKGWAETNVAQPIPTCKCVHMRSHKYHEFMSSRIWYRGVFCVANSRQHICSTNISISSYFFPALFGPLFDEMSSCLVILRDAVQAKVLATHILDDLPRVNSQRLTTSKSSIEYRENMGKLSRNPVWW